MNFVFLWDVLSVAELIVTLFAFVSIYAFLFFMYAKIVKRKTVEVRILKEKSQAIQPGDYITFHHIDDNSKTIKVLFCQLYCNIHIFYNYSSSK